MIRACISTLGFHIRNIAVLLDYQWDGEIMTHDLLTSVTISFMKFVKSGSTIYWLALITKGFTEALPHTKVGDDSNTLLLASIKGPLNESSHILL